MLRVDLDKTMPFQSQAKEGVLGSKEEEGRERRHTGGGSLPPGVVQSASVPVQNVESAQTSQEQEKAVGEKKQPQTLAAAALAVIPDEFSNVGASSKTTLVNKSNPQVEIVCVPPTLPTVRDDQ